MQSFNSIYTETVGKDPHFDSQRHHIFKWPVNSSSYLSYVYVDEMLLLRYMNFFKVLLFNMKMGRDTIESQFQIVRLSIMSVPMLCLKDSNDVRSDPLEQSCLGVGHSKTRTLRQ